jgi:hypothetical protein
MGLQSGNAGMLRRDGESRIDATLKYRERPMAPRLTVSGVFEPVDPEMLTLDPFLCWRNQASRVDLPPRLPLGYLQYMQTGPATARSQSCRSCACFCARSGREALKIGGKHARLYRFNHLQP